MIIGYSYERIFYKIYTEYIKQKNFDPDINLR